MEQITFITGNPKKAEVLGKFLGTDVLFQSIDLPEIQSVDVEKVALDKAERAFLLIQKPVLVEDTSLHFHALSDLPGTFIKWFLEGVGNEGLCNMLSSYTDRSATAKTCIVLKTATETVTFIGETTGTIATAPQTETDFGWNAIFIPDGLTKSWAEMNIDDQNKDSMRVKALEKLKSYLETK